MNEITYRIFNGIFHFNIFIFSSEEKQKKQEQKQREKEEQVRLREEKEKEKLRLKEEKEREKQRELEEKVRVFSTFCLFIILFKKTCRIFRIKSTSYKSSISRSFSRKLRKVMLQSRYGKSDFCILFFNSDESQS